MDADQVRKTATDALPRGDAAGTVSSRRQALDRLHAALEAGHAYPVLVTGEAGAGKTWLGLQLGRNLSDRWKLIYVDLTRGMNALDFLQLIIDSLGIAPSDNLGSERTRLRAALHDEAVDGRRWALVIDEAHRGSPHIWDEIHALINQSCRGAGFAGLVLLADSELVRVFSTREHAGIASTVKLHLHLRPLDLDEARELLRLESDSRVVDEPLLEELHRDARGNAGELIRLARTRPTFLSTRPSVPLDHRSVDASQASRATTVSAEALPRWPNEPAELPLYQPAPGPVSPAAVLEIRRPEPSSLLPSKPPIRLEEGLVEVGWDGDAELGLLDPDDATANEQMAVEDDTPSHEELVEDHYAALQAWGEWTERSETKRGGAVAAEMSLPRVSAEPTRESSTLMVEERLGLADSALPTAAPGVRAEAQHEFAPYSQLFTRLRQSKQP